MANIYQKIIEIRRGIDGFTKDKKGFNFSYVTGGQVLSRIQDKMDELGVVLEPHITTSGHEKHEYLDKYSKAKIDFVVWGDMEYHWVNAEDPTDRIIVKWTMFGQQGDISQAFGSGLTYSERYFLLKYFGRPTDEDDPDKRNYNTDTKKEKQDAKEEAAAMKNVMTVEQAAALKISFGEYVAKPLGEIYKTDIECIKQLVKECSDETVLKAIGILKVVANSVHKI